LLDGNPAELVEITKIVDPDHDLSNIRSRVLGVMPDVFDRCQNHVLAGSRVRRHSLKHDYADETKQAWAKLGAAIEAALARRLRLVSRPT